MQVSLAIMENQSVTKVENQYNFKKNSHLNLKEYKHFLALWSLIS